MDDSYAFSIVDIVVLLYICSILVKWKILVPSLIYEKHEVKDNLNTSQIYWISADVINNYFV